MTLLLSPILGGLSHDSVKIWARADSAATMHIWLATKEDLSDAKYLGAANLPPENGCAGVFLISKLKPETRYFYAVRLKKTRPTKKEFHDFTTFPKPGTRRTFNFMFGSCYRPPDEHGGETFDHLRDFIKNQKMGERPRFGLFLGDQIYADAVEYNGLGRVAVTLEEYRKVYEHNWSRPVMRDFLPSLPLFMTLDDHEVDDDWRWRNPSRQWADISILQKITRYLQGRPPQERHLSAERVRAALKAFEEHQAIHAPEMLLPFETDARGEVVFHQHDPASFAYTFYFGNAAFFVLDTRTMRVSGRNRSMLGKGQWRVLQEWLKEVKDEYKVKFIVSSCSLLHPFFFDIANDRWMGFPKERERLLEFLAVNEIEGVRILAGDLHSGHAITAQLKCPSGKRISIAEFCASPFEQNSIWISFGYIPLLSKWLARQKRHFYRAFNNFGIVHVNFDSPEPTVTFTLHYHTKKEWKTASVTA